VADTRIYLDAQGGQRPNPAVLDLTRAMVELSWPDGKSRHHESALSQNAMELALESLAKSMDIPRANLLPVHRLGNAFELLAQIYPNTAVSGTSRRGAIQSFSGPKLAVDQYGRLNEFPSTPNFFASAANQETGVIEDLENVISKTGAKAIVDATEWIGRTTNLPAGDVFIARASSWGGPNSVCFLISESAIEIDARKSTSLMPSYFDLLLAASAFEHVGNISDNEARIRNYSISICEALSQSEQIRIHGDKHSLPHLISFDIKNVDSETAAIAFDKAGIAVGSGSACSVSNTQSSHVLEAMGIQSAGNVRLSIPLDFSQKDLEYFLLKLPLIINDLT
jgi:cysteine desulfurase